jgi:predicted patatin/cPLA2 family phospholipase
VTRLSDRAAVLFDTAATDDPLQLLLASNYLPPFYTRAPQIGGVRYGDGGLSDSLPYEAALERGCEMVVIIGWIDSSRPDHKPFPGPSPWPLAPGP